jgi:hypothetical protein
MFCKNIGHAFSMKQMCYPIFEKLVGSTLGNHSHYRSRLKQITHIDGSLKMLQPEIDKPLALPLEYRATKEATLIARLGGSPSSPAVMPCTCRISKLDGDA